MKRNKLIIMSLAIATLAMASCRKESTASPVKPDDPKKVFITFSAFSGNGTKTTMDSSFIYWTAKDTISVFDQNSGNNRFSLTKGEGTNSGTFSGETVLSGRYYAVYPYNSEYSITYTDSTILNVTLPYEQKIPDGKYVDPTATLMVAASTDSLNLPFHNLVSYVKFTPKMNCSAIFIGSKGGETAFAGKGTVSVKDTALKVEDESKEYHIDLTGKFIAGQSYYAAVLPGKHTTGITVGFQGDTAVYSSTTDKPVTFIRGSVYDAGGGQYAEAVIWSEGLNAKDLSSRWDLAPDGANKLNHANKLEIKTKATKDEGKYQKNLNGAGSVWLEFGDSTCYICTSAKYIFTTPGTTYQNTFSGSFTLRTIVGLDNVSFIEMASTDGMFGSSTINNRLDTIDVSGFDMMSVTNCASMFKNCKNLKTIKGSDRLTLSEKGGTMNGMFYGCSTLDSLDLSRMEIENVDTKTMFLGCNKLRVLILSEYFILSTDEKLSYNTFAGVGSGLTGGKKCKVYGLTQDQQNAIEADSTNNMWSRTRMEFAE